MSETRTNDINCSFDHLSLSPSFSSHTSSPHLQEEISEDTRWGGSPSHLKLSEFLVKAGGFWTLLMYVLAAPA